jgi:preprotein translocase subunit SecG
MLYGLLILLYVAVSVVLILVVLLQTGKRADLAGAFGGGGSQTALGTRGAANLLTRATTVSAVLFMVLALTLSIMTSRRQGRGGSVLDEVSTPATGSPASVPDGLAQPTLEEPLPEEAPPVDAEGSSGDPASP